MALVKSMLSRVCANPTLCLRSRSSCPHTRSESGCPRDLKEILREQIPKRTKLIAALRKKHDKTKLGEINMGMLWGGMRGMKGLICDTSVLDAEEGIRFRGMSIPEVRNCLPKAPGGEEPLPEGIFWLMVAGEIPTTNDVNGLSKELARRAEVPCYVIKMLKNFPKNVHPMAQFSAAITVMNTESQFVKAYNKNVDKNTYWESIYEDSLNLIAKLPGVAALIYLNLYRKGREPCPVDADQDWSNNFATMLGYSDCQFIELLRLYLTIHCDHEGGNVSAHATHLVGSALSDPYLSFAAGMNGLAGPLHGLANQNVLIWLMEAQKELPENASDDQVKEFVEKTLKTQVVPGYGHAVLRKTDPRYTAQQEFAMKHIPDDPLVELTAKFYKVVPPVLTSLGKVQNPWPNVDAHSGVLLYHYGMTEMSYYTVLFGVSRALGVLAQLIWSRALRFPIERPKSLSTECLLKELKFSPEKDCK